MQVITRRRFLENAGTGAAAALALGAAAKAAPSERVRHAIIGCGGQGKRHALSLSAFPDCELAVLCDIDPERRAKVAGLLPGNVTPRQVEDFRDVLDDPEIDSVSITTPDHWHTPLALHALAAGKHVYVEKPCCHTIQEGRVLLEAAANSGKCIQHGTQARSSEGIRKAIEWLRAGNLGKVRAAKALNHQLREPIGRAPESEPPPGVNYDRWLGPAPLRPFTQNRWHYNWHWFWEYGGGDMVNDGIHQVDQARWGLGVGLPDAISASGGQLFYDDDHETPDTQMITFEYDGCYLIYEMRLWTDYPCEGHDNGVVFYCDQGILEIGRKGCHVTRIGEDKRLIGVGTDFDANLRNFLDCLKQNNPAGLLAPMEEAVVSSALCHLGNIATRVNRKLFLDAERWECKNDPEASALFMKQYRAGYELPIAT